MVNYGPSLAVVILLGVFTSSSALADQTLQFGIYSSDKPSAMVEQFRPTLNWLEKSLSTYFREQISIKIQVSATYEEGIEALASGRVDFGRLGPVSYVEAKKKNPELEIIVMEAKKGKKEFNGIICVAEKSDIESVSNLEGKRFAFGSKMSTIGRFLSQQYLMDHQIIAKDLASYQYLGRHDVVGTAVAKGEFDAGALKESTFKKLKAKGFGLRSIASFPNVTKPWVASSDLESGLKDKLRSTLLELKHAEALNALGKDGFVLGSHSDFSKIEESIRENDGFFK